MVRRVGVDLVATDRVSRPLDHMGDSAMRNAGKLSRLGTGAIAAGTAIGTMGASILAQAPAMAKGMLDTAVSVEAMGNKTRIVFGSARKSVEDWAGRVAEKMGQTRTQTASMAASFGDILTPMGFTQARAATLSTKLGDLTGAFVQWSNGTANAADVADALNDALTGDFESLKQFGVVLDQDTLKGLVAKAGKDKLTGSALRQAEAEVALSEIYRQSANAVNNYNEENNKLGGSVQRLKARFAEKREELANRLMPVFTKLSSWVLDKAIPAIEDFGGKVMFMGHLLRAGFTDGTTGSEGLIGALEQMGSGFKRVYNFVRAEVIPRGKELWEQFSTKGLPILRKVVVEGLEGVRSGFAKVSKAFNDNRPQLESLFQKYKVFQEFIMTKVWPLLGPVAKVTFSLLGGSIAFGIVMISRMTDIISTMWRVAKSSFSLMAKVALDAMGLIINGAARTFSWVPGLGPKLKEAAKKFNTFRDDVNRALSGIKDRTVKVSASIVASQATWQAIKEFHGAGGPLPGKYFAGGPGGWPLPTQFRHVTSGFGANRGSYRHQGIDLAAPSGTPVYATKAGTVSATRWWGGGGNMLAVSHGGGLLTRYMHLSRYLAHVGQRVGRGQVVALSGNTGQSTGPHLHWQVEVNGTPVYPIGRRHGGRIRANVPYMTSEDGRPELVVPDTGGMVISNETLRALAMTGAGGGGERIIAPLVIQVGGHTLVEAILEIDRNTGGRLSRELAKRVGIA